MPMSVKRITLSGVLIALGVLCIFLASILPSGRLSLYALSSFLGAVIIVEAGIKYGWLLYLLTVLLSLILIPVKTAIFPYLLFFGPYGVIKCHLEKIQNKYIAGVLKFIFFNCCLFGAYGLFFYKLNLESYFKTPLIVVFLVLQVVFGVFDFVFTGIIDYYKKKIRRILFK